MSFYVDDRQEATFNRRDLLEDNQFFIPSFQVREKKKQIVGRKRRNCIVVIFKPSGLWYKSDMCAKRQHFICEKLQTSN